jgi:pimeloyl-ACP methyl ester carboxylesterase
MAPAGVETAPQELRTMKRFPGPLFARPASLPWWLGVLAALAASLGLPPMPVAAGERVSHCGGGSQEACKLWEAVPSCDPFLYESVESCGFLCFVGMCRELACGGLGERACVGFIDHPWPGSCEAGTGNVHGVCSEVDANGFPSFCGHDGQPACTLDLQISLGVASCAPRHFEEGFPFGTCRALDDDGFPRQCGDPGEPACTADLQLQVGVGACKPGVEEVGFPAGSCRWPLDMDRPARRTWGPEEAPPGPRTIFLVHGAGSSNTAWDGGLVPTLEGGAGLDVYVVDYNTTGDGAPAGEPFTVYRRMGGALAQVIDASGAPLRFGTQSFNGENFDLPTVSDALAEAIETLPTRGEIAVIGHSMGGLVVRQLVYEHYDSLRLAGKRIAEVVTLATPHQGGGLDPWEAAGAVTQVLMCSRLGVTHSSEDTRQSYWQNCEAYRWRNAIEALRVSVDERDYPEIRWVLVAGTGHLVDLTGFIGFTPPFPFDSDGIVPVQSAFGIYADDCFPHDHVAGANGTTRISVEIRGTFIGVLPVSTAVCHDPRHDPADPPAYAHDERLDNLRYDRDPPEPYGHGLQDDPTVHAFVRSLLVFDDGTEPGACEPGTPALRCHLDEMALALAAAGEGDLSKKLRRRLAKRIARADEKLDELEALAEADPAEAARLLRGVERQLGKLSSHVEKKLAARKPRLDATLGELLLRESSAAKLEVAAARAALGLAIPAEE